MSTLVDTPEAEEGNFDEQPSVLQKLQKWGDYEAFGGAVAPTNFVPMKTPLGSEILRGWNLQQPPRYPLSVANLLRAQLAEGRKVGMIIDLSNHETLYGADLQGTGVQYKRIPLIAKVFPTQRAVNRVIEVAERFWSEHPELYIAIHCAYGFNRTGFVVCSYLVQACNLTVQDALDSFAAARPPGIRHDQFVLELHKRYDGFRSERPIPGAPSLSDLRGFGGTEQQKIGSLNSDFLGVAEHLQETHPSLADRPTGSPQDASLNGNSDSRSGQELPQHLPQHPSAKGRNSLANLSGVSLEGGTSNCESVNNESLDLDERDIYKHFASRQQGPLPPAVEAGRHHRRKGIAPALPTLRQSEESNHSSKSSPSPFASVQNGEDVFASTLHSEAAVDSSIGSNEGGKASLQRSSDAQPDRESAEQDSQQLAAACEGRQPNGTSGSCCSEAQSPRHSSAPHRPAPLLRGPVTERVFKDLPAGNSAGNADQHQEGILARLPFPCRLM